MQDVFVNKVLVVIGGGQMDIFYDQFVGHQIELEHLLFQLLIVCYVLKNVMPVYAGRYMDVYLLRF